MADETNREAPAETAAAARGRGLLDNKVVLLGAIVIVQILLALGITRFVIMPRLGVQGADMAAGEAAAAADQQSGILVGLQEMVVTLQGEGGAPAYLRINVNLEVSDQKTADRVTQRLPELRDIVIMTLSSKRAPDLLTPEGKQSVRGEIFRRLAERLPAESLRSVYFSDLVIQ